MDERVKDVFADNMELIYKLSDQISTFYNATTIPVQLLDKTGEVIEPYGGECSYCELFKEACGKFCPCEQSHMYAFKESEKLGEGYISSCPAGYVHFAVAVNYENNTVANILAGPVALDYPNMDIIDAIIRKYNISVNLRSRLYQNFSSAQLVEPYRARYLCKLLSSMISNLVRAEILNYQMKNLSKKESDKDKVIEYTELVRDTRNMNSQYDMEKKLIEYVVSGDKEHAKAILNEMLGRIYFTSANNIEIIKARSIELIALLSRTVIENGGSEELVYNMTDSSLRNISGVKDLTDLSYILLDILEMFSNAVFSKYKKSDIPSLQKALEYIEEHYTSPICLEEVAEYSGLNPAYLSSLFKKEMGVNFSNYVTEKRMNQAKNMLKNTNAPLVEIAMSLGYENQSYFSSVFKKYCNMTPKEYRYKL